MKKVILSIIVLIVISLSAFTFIACEPKYNSPGWDQLYELKIADKDSLKIIFGSQYLYPDTEEYSNISVRSKQGDTLYYKKNLIEYMPEVVSASWIIKVNDVEFMFVINKNAKNVTDIDIKDLDKTKVIGELSVFYKSGTTILENELENRYISCLFSDVGGTYLIGSASTIMTQAEISEIAFEFIGNMKRE